MNAHRTDMEIPITVEEATRGLLLHGRFQGAHFLARWRDEPVPPGTFPIDHGAWVVEKDGTPIVFCHDEVQCAHWLTRFDTGELVEIPDEPILIEHPMRDVYDREERSRRWLSQLGYL